MTAPVLTYYNIAPRVTAFSTTRHGGVSRGNYGGLNVNAFCGDDTAAVAVNRRALCRELGVAQDRLLLPHQVHGTVNLTVDRDVVNMPAAELAATLEGVDSLTTNLTDVCIAVSTADCIPVLLYDRVHQAVAAVHAGWRGTVRRIVQHTVDAMRRTYATVPSDLVAVIGPGISLKNFEVGQEVYDAFAAEGFDMSRIARKYAIASVSNGSTSPSPFGEGRGGAWRWHIDLPLCNELQLCETGIRQENIVRSGVCTYDSVADYFSARRLGTASGRICTGIILRKP